MSRMGTAGVNRGMPETYTAAAQSLEKRDEKIDACAEVIETELELLGATAIEDKLQEGVQVNLDIVKGKPLVAAKPADAPAAAEEQQQRRGREGALALAWACSPARKGATSCNPARARPASTRSARRHRPLRLHCGPSHQRPTSSNKALPGWALRVVNSAPACSKFRACV